MKRLDHRKIYIISGPCGVGKSTLAKLLAENMRKVVLIEADQLSSMFIGEEQPEWEEKLSIVWQNLFSLSKNFLEHGLDIVIDYVVEDELEEIKKQFSKLNVDVYYVVLRADEDVIKSRLAKRGDSQLLNRSLFLLEKLENDPFNQPYLYNTTDKEPYEIIEELKSRFDCFKL